MEPAEALQILKDAQHDPAKLALATVDLVHSELLESDRVALKGTLEAAAIPHWCDATILAALIDIPEREGTIRLARLRELTVVEPFPARGGNSINVHEAARIALRNRIASEDDVRFRGLAARATACFAEDHTRAGRIEWVYHLLCSKPESGADELQKLDRDWSGSAPPEDRDALSAALNELEDNRLIEGRARLWVLLVMAWNLVEHGESAQFTKMAETTLSLARSLGDTSAEGEAQALLGAGLQAERKLKKAKAAFEQSLTIFHRLTEGDPNNSDWQRNLGVVHSRLGDVHKGLEDLAEAKAAFEQYLAIFHRLTERDPNNSDWQWNLGVAHSRLGDVHKGLEDLAEAKAAFEQYLAIFHCLSERDPSNTDWQRALGVAYSRLGDVHKELRDLAEAKAAFEQYLAIFHRLAEQDPSNTDWQRALGVAHTHLGDVHKELGDLAEAKAAFEQSLAIFHRLAEQDPSNTDWQRALGVAHSRLGDVEV